MVVIGNCETFNFFYIIDLAMALVQRIINNFPELPYQYVPSESIAIMFIVLFGFSTSKISHLFPSAPLHYQICCESVVVHLSQAIFYRMWWLFPTVGFCGVLEILGWSARLWSSFSPSLGTPFEMQSVL